MSNLGSRSGKYIPVVEGIDGSAALADQPIMVEIDPNGPNEEPGFLIRDRVRTTVIKLEITEIDLPNDDVSFTTRDENQIPLTANIEPDYYDEIYNSQIDWTVDDNWRYNYDEYRSGTPADPPNGHETTLEITVRNYYLVTIGGIERKQFHLLIKISTNTNHCGMMAQEGV